MARTGGNIPFFLVSSLVAVFLPAMDGTALAALPAECGAGAEVRQDGANNSTTTIQLALDLLPRTLGATTCVVIRDTQTYSEQVTIQGFTFTTGTDTLHIMSDPSFVSSAPVVNPPWQSTAAFRIMNASVTIQGISVISTNAVTYGVWASSGYVTISSVTIADGAGSINTAGVYINNSWANVSYASVTMQSGIGLWINGGARNSVSYSAVQSDAVSHGVWIYGSSYNTLVGNYFDAVVEVEWGAYNTISRSTMTNIGGGSLGLSLNNTSSNMVTQSYMTSEIGAQIWRSSYNALSQNYFAGIKGGASIRESDYNTLSQSTFTGNIFNYAGLSFSTAVGNFISQSQISNPYGYAVTLGLNSVNNTIDRSTVTSAAAGYSALYLMSASSNTFINSYIQGSTAVYVSGSTGTVISGSVLVATHTSGIALALSSGSVNLTLTTTTLRGGPQGAGLFMDPGNSGSIVLTSNTIAGGRWGVYISTMNCGGSCTGTNLSISSMIFPGGLSPGATAIHFTGGSFVSTFSYAAFNDPNIAINVSGVSIDDAASPSPASRITLRADSGLKTGPTYELDYSPGVLGWPDNSPNQPPGSPSISTIYLSSITVNWGLVGASAYILNASTASNFSGTLFLSSTTDAAATSLTVHGLAQNTTYYLRAGALWSGTTLYADTTPTSAMTLVRDPAPLLFSAITINQFTVAWSSNSNPTNTLYQASLSTDIAFTTITSSVSTVLLSFTFTSLTPQTTYYARVRAVNATQTPSAYALGAVVTQLGVITISANRLTNFWYNLTDALFFAQGATIYHYRITDSPTNTAVVTDPAFNGNALSVTLSQGLNYFHVYGTDGGSPENYMGAASFGPVEVDTGSPVMVSLSAQTSATDTTPILDGGSTLSNTPRLTWPAASSLSPILGYSLSLSADSSVTPSGAITTTILFSDQSLSAPGASVLYYAKVAAVNLAGNLGPYVGMSFTYTRVPNVSDIIVKNNYFNPMDGTCMQLEVRTAVSGHVKAQLFTLLGRKVATLADGGVGPSAQNYSWCGRNSNNEPVASGVYLLHVESPGVRRNFKVGVMK